MDPEQDQAIRNLMGEAENLNRNADGNEPLGIVSIVDAILAILVAQGLAMWKRLLPNEVGVHPSNRYGFGVSWAIMHKLMSKIKRLGFSWFACQGAVCIEDDDKQTVANYTVKLQNSAEGFGRSKLTEIRDGSLGGDT